MELVDSTQQTQLIYLNGGGDLIISAKRSPIQQIDPDLSILLTNAELNLVAACIGNFAWNCVNFILIPIKSPLIEELLN